MRERGLILISAAFIISALLIIGCSGHKDAAGVASIETPATTGVGQASHCCWGVWQFAADPVNGTLDVSQIRAGNFHLNALVFLEPPVLVFLTLDSLQFNGNIIEADIGLRHPFLGLDEFTGFDVCGVLVTNGSVTGFQDADIRMAGEGDTRLLNPDGFARWWNPAEFPAPGTMFGYKDGLLGTPDSVADYNSTVNGYKYYCDDLGGADELPGNINIDRRGMFSAGKKNVRHFTIELGADGLTFNYAVDASWQPPSGQAPWTVPDDFGPGANRSEAWCITVHEIENTLWNDGADSGGGLELHIDVYDWFNAELNTVRVESPGNFDFVDSTSIVGGGPGYSTYEVEITHATPAPDEIELLISVISEKEDFEGFIPGVNTTSYFNYMVDVETGPAVKLKNIPLRDDETARDLAVTPQGDLLILYNDGAVWKHYAADVFTQDTAEFLFTAQVVPCESEGQVCNAHIDVSSAGNVFASAPQGTGFGMDSWPCQSFDSAGNPIGSAPGPGTGGPVPDVYIYPPGGYYSNNHMVLAPNSTGTQNNMYRHVLPYDWAQIYETAGENAPTGYDKVKFTQVVGSEASSGNQFWLIEDTPDYYAARWMHTGTSWGYFNFDNAWFGTGIQTEDDTGWCEAKDLTKDSSGHFYVLDKLPSGQGRIKLFESGSPGNPLTDHAAGDASTISETPLRIEGSDYDSADLGNLIFVLHGDDIPSKLSIFLPEEFGF